MVFKIACVAVAVALNLTAGQHTQGDPLHERVNRAFAQISHTAARLTETVGSRMNTANSVWHSQGSRRLATKQCAWNGGKCGEDASFVKQLLPASGAARSMYDGEAVCAAHSTQAKCTEQSAKDAKCHWDGTACEYKDDAAMLGSLDFSNCGFYGDYVAAAAKCSGLAASSSSCSAANKCVKQSGFVNNAGTCSQQDTCTVTGDITQILCPDANFNIADVQSKFDKCASENQELLNGKTASDPEGQLILMPCAYKDCSKLGDMSKAILEASIHCSKKTTSSSCSAENKCSWTGSECEASNSAAMISTIPNTCKALPMFQCSGKQQSACTGACTWQSSPDCSDDGTPQTESTCDLSEIEAMKAVSEMGDTGFKALYNGMLVAENCKKQTTENSCVGASVAITPSASRALCAARVPMGIVVAIGLAVWKP